MKAWVAGDETRKVEVELNHEGFLVAISDEKLASLGFSSESLDAAIRQALEGWAEWREKE